MTAIRLVAVLASAGVIAGTADSAPPTVSFVVAKAAPGESVFVHIAGVRPGRARLRLAPGGVLLDPIFRVTRRGTARFRATIPNVPPGDYRLAAVRNRRILACSSRLLRIVDPPPGVRGCARAVYGDLAPGWEQRALRAGPIAFVGMARGVSADDVARYKNVIKVLLVVDNGAVVTLRVADADRRGVALSYTGRAATRVAEGLPAVRFRACDGRDGRPHTQFNGGFIVDRTRCAHLDVQVGGRPERVPVTIAFGAPC